MIVQIVRANVIICTIDKKDDVRMEEIYMLNKYFKISHDGYDMKIIISLNKYECIGYYLLEVLKDVSYAESIDIEEVSSEHKIEMSCIGFPVYKTVEDLYSEKENGTTPSVVIGLIE